MRLEDGQHVDDELHSTRKREPQVNTVNTARGKRRPACVGGKKGGAAALVALALAVSMTPQARATCGDVVSIATHGGTTTRYSHAGPPSATIALVLLPGGAGHLDLDEDGCPRKLKGNSLVRSAPLFHAAGFRTALVDAPSDHHGPHGLGGFRVTAEHAGDIGKVIADVRRRTGGAVWLVGTSRGAISAVHAAARLGGASAPDGLVLTSAVMVGNPAGRVPWVAHSVFDADLAAIRPPVLLVGHAQDACVRSPAAAMTRVAERLGSQRKQVVIVTGGPGGHGLGGAEACEGRSPHGFLDQEAEVAAGIVRFVRGGNY